MHVAVVFENIGGYHAARLRAAHAACVEKKWAFTAIQISAAQGEHPWGTPETDFPVETLRPPDFTFVSAPGLGTTRAKSGQSVSGDQVTDLLNRLRPTAVAIPGWGFGYSRAALAWCRRNQAVAVVMSESKYDDQKRFWLKEFLKARLVRKFDAAFVGAQSHADYLARLGFPREHIFRGYDIVDNEHFAHAARIARENPALARTRQPLIPERPYFLAVTRLIPRKNIARLVDAFADYRKHAPAGQAWDLVICGSGSEEPHLRDLVGQRQLEKCVHFPGFLTYRAIGDWYGLAGAFIHPALQEQWGLVVNEAMAAGLPVLVSNRCGCFPELVREKITGFGFDPEQTAQITELMSRCASGGVDLAAMGRAAAAHIENFSPRHFAEGLLAAVHSANA